MPVSQLHRLFGDLHKSTFVLRHLCLAINGGIGKIAIVEVFYHLLEPVIDFSNKSG